MQKLQNIKGTGNQGRVSKKDILNYIAERKNINNNNQNIVNQSFTDTNNIVTTGAPRTDGTNGTPRTGNETSPKYIGKNKIIKAFNV